MRQHPIAIFRYIYKKFWLLVIPFLRALTHTESIDNILKKGLFFDLFVLSIIVIMAIVRWFNTKYNVIENGINISEGIFLKREIYIPFNSISMVKTGEWFLVKPFNAVMVSVFIYAEMEHYKHQKSGQTMLLKLIDYKQIFNNIPNHLFIKKRGFRLPKGRLLLYSFAYSSVLSGMVYFSAMLVQIGSTVKNEFERMFVSAVNDVTQIAEKVIVDITPFTAAVIVIIVISWIISFGMNYLKNINFKSVRHEKMLMTENGYFYKEKKFIDIKKLSFIDFRQNLMMKFFGTSRVIASCSENMIVVIPFCSKKAISGFTRMLIPEMYREEKNYSGRKKFMRYVAVPLIMMYGVIAAGAAAVISFPDWYRLIFFSSIMSEILILHFYAVRFISYYISGAVCMDDLTEIKYSKFFYFYDVVIPSENILGIKMTSTLLQKMSSSCDLKFYAAGNKSSGHKVKGLEIYDAEKLVKEIFKENHYEKQK